MFFNENFWQNFVKSNESITLLFVIEPRLEKNLLSAYAKTKAQNSCTVTTKLISAFLFPNINSTIPNTFICD